MSVWVDECMSTMARENARVIVMTKRKERKHANVQTHTHTHIHTHAYATIPCIIRTMLISVLNAILSSWFISPKGITVKHTRRAVVLAASHLTKDIIIGHRVEQAYMCTYLYVYEWVCVDIPELKTCIHTHTVGPNLPKRMRILATEKIIATIANEIGSRLKHHRQAAWLR